MPIPSFDAKGELPVGVHRATRAEVLSHFSTGTPQRQAVTARLEQIHRLALATGKLERFVIFGSYVTDKPEPNDVDIILVMQQDFRAEDYDEETRVIFDHLRAAEVLGASIFSTTRAGVLGETVDEFLAYWQIKRDQTHRGIVEMIA